MFQPFNESYVRASVQVTLDHEVRDNEEQVAQSERYATNPARANVLTRFVRWLLGARVTPALPAPRTIKHARPSHS